MGQPVRVEVLAMVGCVENEGIAQVRTIEKIGQGVIDIPAVGKEKDVIVACSGFDGLIEEMYSGMLTLAENGYRFHVLVEEIVKSDAFLKRRALQDELADP